MSKKVLFCATVDYHFKAFHLPFLKWFKDQGWEVHVAANGTLDLPYVDQKYNIPIQRSPFKVSNFKAYIGLKKIIEENNYDIIHCHTPMGGVITRLAARKARKSGTKVIYTAHGFHFCKGSPLVNWLIYYPIEKGLANVTDCLITINKEDYNRAINHHFPAKNIEHVHGVGVDQERFHPVSAENRIEMRKKFGYNPEDFLMFYAAEFNRNKNQQLLIQALANIKKESPNSRLLLAGNGPLFDECRNLAKALDVSEKIDFLGYRKDINEILPMCDLAVASSLREGLPVNIMEAMACGLPVIARENRGHRELVRNDKNGWLIGEDAKEMSEKILMMERSNNMKEQLGNAARKDIENTYALDRVLSEMEAIYRKFME